MNHRFFLIGILIGIATLLRAQRCDTILVIEELTTDKPRERIILPDSSFHVETWLQDEYYKLIALGHIEARIDTIRIGSTLQCRIRPGMVYKLRRVYISSDSITGHNQLHTPLSRYNIELSVRKTLRSYENNGFPFATLQLDSLHWERDRKGKPLADIYWRLEAGPYIVLDSLHVKSLQPLPYRYIRSYLEFKPGKPYNEAQMNRAASRLRELPFLTVKQSPEVRFTPGEASLFVFAERRKANFFNGIAGVRPDEATQKVNLTGDVEMKLVNAFNRGEELWLNWRKLQAQTQDLSANVMLPYLFRTPLGIDSRVKIYKRDTTFTSLQLSTGLTILFSGTNRMRLFIEKNRSNQLTTFVTANSLANVNNTLYGMGAQAERLDYRWNPRKGFSCSAEIATGFRNISSTAANDATNNKRGITRLEGFAEYYFPIRKKQCIMTGIKGASLFAESLYNNELLRIGGMRTIRGINEESIFASSWVVTTLEYRVLPDESSALYLFCDQAWYEQQGVSGFATDHPINFGVGFNFQARAGVFTFNYALGKQFDNPILVRNAKISFGFRSLF